MDPISNNELAPAPSQSHLSTASYINSRGLLTHLANFSSHERPKSKSPNVSGSINSAPSTTASADIYSAILNTQQHQQTQRPLVGMKENAITAAEVAGFSSPIRHLSEPSNAPNRDSPMVNEPIDQTPRSCHTSPSIPMKSFQQLHHQQQQSVSPPRSMDSPPNHTNSNNSSSIEPQSSTTSSSASVFSLTQSSLQELIRKSGNSISADEIKKANNSSQLYLLVPSNYPVLLAVGNEQEKTAAAAVAAASTMNEATTRSLLERFQLNSSSTSVPSNQPAPQPPIPSIVQPPVPFDGGQRQMTPVVASLPRAPRKNSTNIPPMLLQSLNFREIFESGGAAGNGGGANLSSFDLAYGASELPTTGSGDRPSLPGERKKSLTVPSGAASFLKKFQAAAAAAAVAAGEVKIKSPPPSSSGAGSTTGASGPESGMGPDSLMGSDSNGNLFFATANESPPTRNYMGRMGGGTGGNQGNASGGDSKDIRRRVSHNEVERRRRDRINTWIAELYKLLPPEQQAKSQYQSKGVVLKRVCEYFQNYDATLKALREENNIYKQEIYRLTQENQLLQSSLNAVHFQQQPNSGLSGTSSVAVGVDVSAVDCDDSKAPSPSKRTHFVTQNE